mmetsp:Transcript_9287/g.28106  ORF Transcript_9287/g.28106 Transcript_9287/m.28106 type:complete len:235 (-) Transcript_9287:342-1046(-)
MSSRVSGAPCTSSTADFSVQSTSLVRAWSLTVVGRLKGAMIVTILTESVGAPVGPRRRAREAYGRRRCCARSRRASKCAMSAQTQAAGMSESVTLSVVSSPAVSAAASLSLLKIGRCSPSRAAESMRRQKDPSPKSNLGAGPPSIEDGAGKKNGSRMMFASPRSFARLTVIWTSFSGQCLKSSSVRMKTRHLQLLAALHPVYMSEICQNALPQPSWPASSTCPNSEKFLEAWSV